MNNDDLNTRNVTSSRVIIICLLSLIPALAVVISEFTFRVWSGNIFLYCLVPGLFLPMICAFIIGKIFRITINFWAALLFSMPTFFTIIFIYLIIPIFITPTVIPKDNVSLRLEDLGFSLMIICASIPFSVLCSVLTATMLIVGSRVQKKQLA